MSFKSMVVDWGISVNFILIKLFFLNFLNYKYAIIQIFFIN